MFYASLSVLLIVLAGMLLPSGFFHYAPFTVPIVLIAIRMVVRACKN